MTQELNPSWATQAFPGTEGLAAGRLSPAARRWLLGLALAAVGALAMRQTWSDILGIALSDPEASHVLLAPIVLAWLAWSRRADAMAIRPRQLWVGPILLALGWAMSWIGFYHGIQVAWHFGAAIVLLGCVVSVVGAGVLGRLLPVAVAMVFLVPIPGTLRRMIALPLQTASAEATRQCLTLIHMQVTRTGNVLHINGADVAIAEGCNGMRLLAPLLMVVYAVAFTRPMRTSTRIALLVAAPLVALAGNVVRLIPTVWLYGFADASVAARFHDVSGWLMAPLTLLVLLGAARLLPRSIITAGPSSGRSSP